MDTQTNQPRWAGAVFLIKFKRVGPFAGANIDGHKFNLTAWGRRLHVCLPGDIPEGLRFRPLFFIGETRGKEKRIY